MTITYLKGLEQHPTLRRWTNEGAGLAEIEAMEREQGHPFPAAYREFLYLAGRRCNLGDIDTGLGHAWMQRKARERLEEQGRTIPGPYRVIYQLDACEQFGFFRLDEQADDPLVHHCTPCPEGPGAAFVQPLPERTFSAFIQACVERAIIADRHLRRP